MPTILNNREWATVIWFAVFVLWILTRRGLRRLVGHLLAAVFKTKLLILICGTAAWVFGLVMLGRVLGLWTAALLGTTVLWFAGAALVLVMRSTGVSNETGFTSKAFKRAIGIAGLVAGFGSLCVFPLVIELILLPVLVMLAAVLALAELRDEHAALRKPLRCVFAFIGVLFLVYVVVHVVADLSGAHLLNSSPLRTRAARVMAQAHRTVLTGDWQGLALPVWLTIGLLPYVYFVGLLAAYEAAFLLIDFCHAADVGSQRQAKLALLLSVHVRARRLGDFQAPWPYRLVSQPTLGGARRVARKFCRAGVVAGASDAG